LRQNPKIATQQALVIPPLMGIVLGRNGGGYENFTGKAVASVMLSTVYAGFIIHHSAYRFSKNRVQGVTNWSEVFCRGVMPCCVTIHSTKTIGVARIFS